MMMLLDGGYHFWADTSFCDKRHFSTRQKELIFFRCECVCMSLHHHVYRGLHTLYIFNTEND